MELWQSIILYCFLAYLFIHLVLEDVVDVYKAICEIKQQHQAHSSNSNQPASDILPGEGDVNHVIDRSISCGDIEQAASRNGPIFPASENTLSIAKADENSDNEHKHSESGRINTAAAPTTYFHPLQKRHIQSSEHYTAILSQQKQRQSSVIILFYKLADITLACVMGYFHVFQVCWVACLSCLQVVLIRYIDFLQDLTRTLTDKEVVKYTAGSAVLCLAIACTTICVLFLK